MSKFVDGKLSPKAIAHAMDMTVDYWTTFVENPNPKSNRLSLVTHNSLLQNIFAQNAIPPATPDQIELFRVALKAQIKGSTDKAGGGIYIRNDYNCDHKIANALAYANLHSHQNVFPIKSLSHWTEDGLKLHDNHISFAEIESRAQASKLSQRNAPPTIVHLRDGKTVIKADADIAFNAIRQIDQKGGNESLVGLTQLHLLATQHDHIVLEKSVPMLLESGLISPEEGRQYRHTLSDTVRNVIINSISVVDDSTKPKISSPYPSLLKSLVMRLGFITSMPIYKVEP